MCGIIGYVGHKDACEVLLDSLERVTYRGYDSFGIAVLEESGIQVHKATGTVEAGRSAIPQMKGTVGVGHTRWATVGKVSRENAHPHVDCTGEITVVHNGNIDNYLQIKRRLESEGHIFRSETDSEVIAHLIETFYRDSLGQAVQKAAQQLEGSYAFIALHQQTGRLAVARLFSSLVIGVGEGETFVASDVPAILPYTRNVLYLEDGDVAEITREDFRVWCNGREVSRPIQQVSWNAEQLSRSNFKHYMLKEVHEQPSAFRDTLEFCARTECSGSVLDGMNLPFEPRRVLFLGCGSSLHAALIAKGFLKGSLDIPVSAVVASEFQAPPRTIKEGLAVAISQSGETADTLAALRQARSAGYYTLAITNVVGSNIARSADRVLCTQAGPELAVAATKTFLTQLAALYLLGISLADLPREEKRSLLKDLFGLPYWLQWTLSETGPVESIGRQLASYDHLFLIARGLNVPVALEGALKFKEVSYVHAEGCAAGELKHGPFALLGPETPVVALMSADQHRASMLTTLREIKARGSPIMAVASEEECEVSHLADEMVSVPRVDPVFSPVLNTVVCQLLSYYCAKERGCPIDQPRNLAKSVTVS